MDLLITIVFASIFTFLASFCEAVPQTRTSVQTSQSLTPSSCTRTSTAYVGTVSYSCQDSSGATSVTGLTTSTLYAPTSISSAGSSATDCGASSSSTLTPRTRLSHSSPVYFSRGTVEISAASAPSSSGRFLTTSTAASRKAAQSNGATYATATSSIFSRSGSLSYLESSVLVPRPSTFGPSNLTVSSFPSGLKSMTPSLSKSSLLSWRPLYSRTTSTVSSATLASNGQRTLVPSTTDRSANSTGNASSITAQITRLSCTAEYSFISFFLELVSDA